MARFTLSAVLGLGMLAGLLSQTASAELPQTAYCKPGYSNSNYSAYYSPYSRSTASYWNDSYDRYGSGYNCGTTSRSTWDNRYDNWRSTSWNNDCGDYSRGNRWNVYNDRNDHRYDRLTRSYNNRYRY